MSDAEVFQLAIYSANPAKYVRHSDYVKLQAENKALREIIEQCANCDARREESEG